MSENQNLSTNLDEQNSNQEPVKIIPPVKKVISVRQGSKMSQLIEMLESPDGTTIRQISTRFNWQNHTARGALSRLGKSYNISLVKHKSANGENVYRSDLDVPY